MDDRRALVLDEIHASLLRDPASVGRPDPKLEPERAGADRRRLPRHVRAELRPPEDVDQVDGLLELRETRHARDAEDLAPGLRVHGQHAIPDAHQVIHDAVARPPRIRRRPHYRDRPRIAQDLGRAPHASHYPRHMPEPVAGAGPTHAEWLVTVPRLLAECVTAWGLTPGEAYRPGAAGHTTRVDLPDGTPAVLKLIYPDRETALEPDALERWDGDGAVRLLARDDERHAMLLERCEPGTFLTDGTDDPLGVLIDLLPRMWKSGDGFHTLEDEAANWLEGDLRALPNGRIRDAAVHYLEELVPTQGEQVLVNQDLHGWNVLAAQREPWLVIDPKPLAGEREFAVAPIVRSSELGHSRRDVLHRLDRLTTELGLDRERALGWTIAQTAAWSNAPDNIPRHIETIEWLLE